MHKVELCDECFLKCQDRITTIIMTSYETKSKYTCTHCYFNEREAVSLPTVEEVQRLRKGR